MTYLIDYENVHNKGLEKINSFKEHDKVVIFYHIDNSKFEISINKFADMIKKKVEFQLEAFEQEKVTDKDKPNYLDFQLATYLGYLISQNEKEQYTIVSNDKDYKAVIDFWVRKGISVKSLKINIANTKNAIVPVKQNSTTIIKVSQPVVPQPIAPKPVEPQPQPKKVPLVTNSQTAKNTAPQIITLKQQIVNEIKNQYGEEIGDMFSKAKKMEYLHNNIVHKLSDTSKSEKQRREIYKKIRSKFKEYLKLK